MLETLSHALDRLAEAGFTEDLMVEDGHLVAASTHERFDPDEVTIAEVVRFEGESDPDDEAIVFALASGDGEPIGTYTLPYGTDTDPADVEIISHLSRKARDEGSR